MSRPARITHRHRPVLVRRRARGRLASRAPTRPSVRQGPSRAGTDPLLARAVESAPCPVAILDASGRVVLANGRARELLEQPPRDDRSHTASAAISPPSPILPFEITSFPLAAAGDRWQLVLFEPRDESGPFAPRAPEPAEEEPRAETLGYLAGGIAHALQARLGLMETIAEGLDASLPGQEWEARQSLGHLRRCLLRSHALVDQLLRPPSPRPQVAPHPR